MARLTNRQRLARNRANTGTIRAINNGGTATTAQLRGFTQNQLSAAARGAGVRASSRRNATANTITTRQRNNARRATGRSGG